MKEPSRITLAKKLKKLERNNKRLVKDLVYMDQLFRMIGFPNGIESLKQSAEEIKNL